MNAFFSLCWSITTMLITVRFRYLSVLLHFSHSWSRCITHNSCFSKNAAHTFFSLGHKHVHTTFFLCIKKITSQRFFSLLFNFRTHFSKKAIFHHTQLFLSYFFFTHNFYFYRKLFHTQHLNVCTKLFAHTTTSNRIINLKPRSIHFQHRSQPGQEIVGTHQQTLANSHADCHGPRPSTC